MKASVNQDKYHLPNIDLPIQEVGFDRYLSWWPQGELNPCLRLERPTSYPLDYGAIIFFILLYLKIV